MGTTDPEKGPLRRLAAKGYLRVRRKGRSNVYASRVRPGRVIGQLVEDFVNRVFDGEALPLVQQLIRDRGLSDEEIQQLQQTLERLKDRRK